MITQEILEKLEYPKVITHITKYCSTENGKQLVTSLLPKYNYDEISKTNLQVHHAKEIIIKNDEPPFEFLPDLFESLSKSKIEGVILSKKEILDIIKLAQQ